MTGQYIRKASTPVQSALDELDAAMENIVRIECAEAQAQEGLRKLEAAIALCLRNGGMADQDDLHALLADYAEMDEVLFLEQAFRADERDCAIAAMTAAQAVLSGGDVPASDRRNLALALTPRRVMQSARLFSCHSTRPAEFTDLY